MKLEKDKWYKFDPYHNDWSSTWWMKSTGEGTPVNNFKASKYIDNSCQLFKHDGQFGNYDRSGCQNYVEATFQEEAWLEDIFILNKYYSPPKSEIINDYNIF